MTRNDSFKTRSTLKVNGTSHTFFSLRKLESATGKSLSRLPVSIKILLENLMRHEDGRAVRREDLEAILNWDAKAVPDKEISFMPAPFMPR